MSPGAVRPVMGRERRKANARFTVTFSFAGTGSPGGRSLFQRAARRFQSCKETGRVFSTKKKRQYHVKVKKQIDKSLNGAARYLRGEFWGVRFAAGPIFRRTHEGMMRYKAALHGRSR